MIDKILNWIVYYLEVALHFVMSYVMTIEGIITIIFGLFFLGLIGQLRS
jgi:hypothetical protein